MRSSFRFPAAFLLIGLVACGGSSGDGGAEEAAPATAGVADASGQETAVDPCAALTARDLREVTGVEPAAPALMEPVSGGVRICNWPMASDTTTSIVSVMAFPAPVMTYEEYLEQTRDAFGDDFDAADYEEVGGLGESAVWSPPTLQAWGKGHMVQIQSGVGGRALDREASVELARRALGRL